MCSTFLTIHAAALPQTTITISLRALAHPFHKGAQVPPAGKIPLALNFFVMRQFGSELLILVSVIMLVKEAQILFEGIGEAITPIIGIYLGEEVCPGVREVWKYAQWSLWKESLISTAFLLVFAPLIVRMLGVEDPVTAEYAVWGLRILSITQIFTCRLFLDSSYFILVDRISLGVFDSFLRDLVPAILLAV